MNCQKAGDLLSAYIEGEVTGHQCQALETHLGGCAECHEELDTLRSALALLAAPKTLVRPEGLLEEFKAKYMPEAEASPAPRWGIRLPVLPKIEWPSLNRMMLPMGGLAGAAAAAGLVIALHGQPTVGPVKSGPTPATRVASNAAADDTTSPGTEVSPIPAAPGASERSPAGAIDSLKPAVKKPLVEPAPSHGHRAPVAAAAPVEHRRLSSPETAPAVDHRPAHRTRRSHALRLAKATHEVAPVPLSVVQDAARRHGEIVKDDELRWRDLDGQGGAIMHKAPAPVAEDGYVEASCKNLSTGDVRSAALSIPADPAPAAPVGDETGKNN